MRSPLAMCDSTSIVAGDLIPTSLANCVFAPPVARPAVSEVYHAPPLPEIYPTLHVWRHLEGVVYLPLPTLLLLYYYCIITVLLPTYQYHAIAETVHPLS